MKPNTSFALKSEILGFELPAALRAWAEKRMIYVELTDSAFSVDECFFRNRESYQYVSSALSVNAH